MKDLVGVYNARCYEKTAASTRVKCHRSSRKTGYKPTVDVVLLQRARQKKKRKYERISDLITNNGARNKRGVANQRNLCAIDRSGIYSRRYCHDTWRLF